MLLVIIGVLLVATIVCFGIYNNSADGFGACMVGVVAAILLGIAILSEAFVFVDIQNCSIIDEKIAICEDANAEIEEKLAETVKSYMQWETDTYKEFTSDSVFAVLSLYPELQSSNMVQEQIATYKANNEEIKQYRLDKVYESIYKWWAYFGG